MGLATNISFADDAYPAMFLGKGMEGMRGIQMSRVENPGWLVYCRGF